MPCPEENHPQPPQEHGNIHGQDHLAHPNARRVAEVGTNDGRRASRINGLTAEQPVEQVRVLQDALAERGQGDGRAFSLRCGNFLDQFLHPQVFEHLVKGFPIEPFGSVGELSGLPGVAPEQSIAKPPREDDCPPMDCRRDLLPGS